MSADALFSQQWYRVSGLVPRVKRDTTSAQHIYREQAWFVLKGPGAGGNLRINAPAHHLLSQFDGERPVAQIWESSLETLGDNAPTQDEMIHLLGDLFEVGVVDFGREADLDQLFDNQKTQSRAEATSRYSNPLFLRFALFNPNRLALTLQPLMGWLFTRFTFVLWLLAMIATGLGAAYAWPELGQSIRTDLVSPRNLLIMWFVFPLMKLIHELAHAVAIRRFGGEVHECGLAILVLLPVPYVDATDSARFSNKWHRIAVASAGILIETGLAAIGLAVWFVVEPGLLRDIALNVFVTGTLSSLLFNGNPLLKFDAYYVLSDLIEVPNLAERASRYPAYLVQRYVLGLNARSPAIAHGERRWLVGYGLIAAIYRFFLGLTIGLYIATHFFFVGVALAVWSVALQLGRPVWRSFRFLWFDERVGDRRMRANAFALIAISAVGAVIFVLPVPHTTAVRAVVWPVDQAVVRTPTDCFVTAVNVTNGTYTPAGTPLIECDEAENDAELAKVRADHHIARAALDATRDRVDRQLLRTELATATERLRNVEARMRSTDVASAVDGQIYLPDAASLTGRFLAQGTMVGYVLNYDKISVRTLLPQDRMELIDERVDSVDIHTLRGRGVVRATKILRRLPAASQRLSIDALGDKGGGDMPVVADDDGKIKLAQPAFEVELALPAELLDSLIGEPVELRFVHGRSSLASLVWRHTRLLLLSRFDV
jgi:putative peptide zinc metalloprotease protein